MSAEEPTFPSDDGEGELIDDEALAKFLSEEPDDVEVVAESGDDDAQEVLNPFAEITRERDEYLDALRRLQAEFDNYRKRMTRQQSELLERASESLLERLLPTLDALDLARAHAGDPSDPEAAQLVAVLGQIASLLRDALAKDGLERIDTAEVAFDPTVHDAVARDPAAEGDEEHAVIVAEILRPGYRLKGRVVRPAMVRVRG
jgi:molecular chaperone GrpE